MTNINTTLLRNTLEYIIDNPDKHDQSAWWYEHPSPGVCSTVGCFAGWAVALTGYKVNTSYHCPVIDFGVASRVTLPDMAARLLGLSEQYRNALFDANNTITDLANISYAITKGEVDLIDEAQQADETSNALSSDDD